MGIRKGYWTKENVKNEALKYSKRFDFYKKSSGAYDKAVKNGWLNEICSHMELSGNVYKRMIYAYEFEDGCAYVGLTYNLKNRNNRHLNDKGSSVYKHLNNKNTKYILIELTDFIEKSKAQELEKYFYLKYVKDGWNMLNIAKTGALGGNTLKWTEEMVKIEALKYKSKSEFKLKSSSAYIAARKNKWLNDVTNHMIIIRKPNNHWTLENCKTEALKYKFRSEFKLKSRGAHNRAYEMGWLDEVRSHMPIRKERMRKTDLNKSQ